MNKTTNTYSWPMRVILAIVVISAAIGAKFSLSDLAAVRSYAACGEVWIDAQEGMMYSIKLYGATRDEADYEKFRYFVDALSGFKTVHHELLRPSPDPAVVEKGLDVTGVSAKEAENMVRYFKKFKDWEYMKKLSLIWDEADLLVSGMEQLGSELRQEVSSEVDISGEDDNSEMIRIMGNIFVVNYKLLDLKKNFKYTLSELDKKTVWRIINIGMGFVIVILAGFLLQLFVDKGALKRSLDFVERSIASERSQMQSEREEMQANWGKEAIYFDKKLKAGDFYNRTVPKENVEEDQKRAGDIFFNAMKQARLAGEVKTQFLVNIFKEIKVPMLAILSFSDQLKKSFPVNEQQEAYLDSINDSGKVLLTYIDDIWGMSKVQNRGLLLQESDFDLKEVILSAVKMVKLALEGRASGILLNYPEDYPKNFKSDPTRIRQIVLNIVSNAVKRSENGDITVDIEFEDSQEKGKAAKRGDSKIVSVIVKYSGKKPFEVKGSDAMEDISNINVDTMGDPEKDKVNIAVSKIITEKMGGSIYVMAHKGDVHEIKAKFRLRISHEDVVEKKKVYPDQDRVTPEEGFPEEAKHAVVMSEKKISDTEEKIVKHESPIRAVVVDPDSSARESIERCLKEAGVEQVSYAISSEPDVVKEVENGDDAPAVVIIDTTAKADPPGYIPGIRKMDKQGKIKIIAITRDANPGTAKNIREAGFDDYIPKLIIKTDLSYIVKAAIEEGFRINR